MLESAAARPSVAAVSPFDEADLVVCERVRVSLVTHLLASLLLCVCYFDDNDDDQQTPQQLLLHTAHTHSTQHN